MTNRSTGSDDYEQGVLYRFSFPFDKDYLARVACELNNRFDYWGYNLMTHSQDGDSKRYWLEFVPVEEPDIVYPHLNELIGLCEPLDVPEQITIVCPGLPTVQDLLKHLRDYAQPGKDVTYLSSIIRTTPNLKAMQMCVVVDCADTNELKRAEKFIRKYDPQAIRVKSLIFAVKTVTESASGVLRDIVETLPRGDQDIYGVALSWHKPYRRLEVAVNSSQDCEDAITDLMSANEMVKRVADVGRLQEMGISNNIQGYRIRPHYSNETQYPVAQAICEFTQAVSNERLRIESLFTAVPDFIPTRTHFCINEPD